MFKVSGSNTENSSRRRGTGQSGQKRAAILYSFQSTSCANALIFKSKKKIVPVPCLLPALYTDDLSPRVGGASLRTGVVWFWCGSVEW